MFPRSLFFALVLSITAAAQSAPEFHHGFGGFGMTTKLKLSDQASVQFALGGYLLFGETLTWKGDSYEVSITISSIVNPSSSSKLTAVDKAAVIEKWKVEVKKQAAEKKIQFGERPYIFDGFKGAEFLAIGNTYILNRAFIIGTRMYMLSLSASSASELSQQRSIPDSFRKLTASERKIAMIEQFSPLPLPQEKPDRLPIPDTAELAMRGKVSRVQEVFQKSVASPRIPHRHIEFDELGFILKDTSFLEGFPDVITAWGWVDGKRVNNQSGVNYPDLEGPQQTRQTVISGGVGTFPSLLPGRPVSRIYGNLVETKLDATNNIVEKRRYAANGTLVLIERITRSGMTRDAKTTDSDGGFIGWIRERLDSDGNVIQIDTLSSDGKPYRTESFEYEFDQKKNWILKRVIAWIGKTKKPSGFYSRTIEYNDVPGRNIAIR